VVTGLTIEFFAEEGFNGCIIVLCDNIFDEVDFTVGSKVNNNSIKVSGEGFATWVHFSYNESLSLQEFFSFFCFSFVLGNYYYLFHIFKVYLFL
jgi:hypothetical protein